jgi:hypothetical protein
VYQRLSARARVVLGRTNTTSPSRSRGFNEHEPHVQSQQSTGRTIHIHGRSLAGAAEPDDRFMLIQRLGGLVRSEFSDVIGRVSEIRRRGTAAIPPMPFELVIPSIPGQTALSNGPARRGPEWDAIGAGASRRSPERLSLLG